jgi:hypothetical protein
MNRAIEGNMRPADLRLLDACLIVDRLCAEPGAAAERLEARLVRRKRGLGSAGRRRGEGVRDLAAA